MGQFTQHTRNRTAGRNLSSQAKSLVEQGVNELLRRDPLAAEVPRDCAFVAVAGSSKLSDGGVQHSKDVTKRLGERATF